MEKVVFVSKNDFDLRMACGAPVRWLKYTTLNVTKLRGPVLQVLKHVANMLWYMF